MRKTMKKLTQGATRLFALALGIGLCRLAAALAVLLAFGAGNAWADYVAYDVISLNVKNDTTGAVSGESTITTPVGDLPASAWHNTSHQNNPGNGDRNGRDTGITAWNGSSQTAETLSEVVFSYAVEGSGVANYGNDATVNTVAYQQAWLAAKNGAVRKASIEVQNIPYEKYSVVVYCSGGTSATTFPAICVNGIPYKGDGTSSTMLASSNSDTWGTRQDGTPVVGVNAIRIDGLTSPDLDIYMANAGGTGDNTADYGKGISAVQIVRDMSAGRGNAAVASGNVMSFSLQSAQSSAGSDPDYYGLARVPASAWTKDALSAGAAYDYDVPVTVKEWNGTETMEVTGVTLHENIAKGYSYDPGSYVPSLNLLSGYADDGATSGGYAQITLSGIPYTQYDVIVYAASDEENKTFGPYTVNGSSYKADSSFATVAASSGDTWGYTRSRVLAYGSNALRITGQKSSTLTIAGPSNDTTTNSRGGIAGFQIVEVDPDIGANDLKIPVSGTTTYTVDAAQELSGTVYLTGNGILTLDGSAKISAATINVGKSVVLNVNADRLDATTFTGAGTVVYTGAKPTTGKGWTDSLNWKGTVWVKDIANDAVARMDWNPDLYGNAYSTLRFTNVHLYFAESTSATVPIEVYGDGLDICDSYGSQITTLAILKGSGTLSASKDASAGSCITITDGSGFTGTITTSYQKFVFGSDSTVGKSGIVQIDAANAVTVPAGKTWTANGGFVVNGTLNVNGTLASSHATKAVSGSGAVVFDVAAPSPTTDAWWKNSNWMGVLWIRNATVTALIPANLANADSTLRLTGVTGYFNSSDSSFSSDGTLDLQDDGETKAFTVNNGYSNSGITTFAKLTGSGTLTQSNHDIFQRYVFKDATAFTGAFDIPAGSETLGNSGNRPLRVIIGNAAEVPNPGVGTITVVAGATATIASGKTWSMAGNVSVDGTLNVNGTLGCSSAVTVGANGSMPVSGFAWASGGITVNGTLTASEYNNADSGNFGGGTTITINDTGKFVLNGATTANVATDTRDYSKLEGTGTLEFVGSSLNYYVWPVDSSKQFASTLSIKNDVPGGIIVSYGTNDSDNPAVTAFRNLFGTGNFRSDWNSSNPQRQLQITQTKDTEWSGNFNNGDRIKSVIVYGTGDIKTLTLAGNCVSTRSIPLTVDSTGSVNLTGTWVGATTVAGTFGGTGTLTGDLTFGDGATFKAFAADSDGLSVSGTVTLPQDGTVTVDVSGIALSGSGTTLMTFTNNNTPEDISAFSCSGISLKIENDALVAYPKAAIVNSAGEIVASFETAQAAVDAVSQYYASYDHFEVYEGTDVSIQLSSLWRGVTFKVKCLNGATVSVSTATPEYAATLTGTTDGIDSYSYSESPTVYTWGGSDGLATWVHPANWRYGSGSAAATRPPSSTDDAVFSADATVLVGSDASIASITNSAAISFTQQSANVTLTATAGGIVLTDAAASITVSGVTLSPTPTTSVAGCIVKAMESEGTTVYTVVAKPSVSEVAFDYGADYATATVTATVSDETASYKLTVGGTDYTGSVSGSTVTFANVATGRTSAYDSVTYTIATADGAEVVGGSGSAVVADTATWFSHNSAGLTGGAWTTAVDLSTPATVEDNTFTPTTPSSSSQVVLEFNVCFSSASDADVDGTAQAAIKIGEVESAATFMVLAPDNEWTAVSNEGLTPDAAKTNKVVMTIDYGGSGSYGVTVDNYVMTNASGSVSFPLAASKKSVQSIDFAGSGVLASMKGDQVEGYMVVDKNGTRYATIAAAIDAYNADPTIGPLTLLHDGTPLSGWSIVTEGGVRILKKLAKGFFFMAY